MKIGIMGTGKIAATVSMTLQAMPEVECYAVGSRTIERAKEFSKEAGYLKAYGSYEELVQDPDVELIYIVTPHSHHFEGMKMCIDAGKPVICEKSFTLNRAEADEIKRLAAEKKVFVTEAIWPRYMPSRKMIDDVLQSGIIGDIHMMTANLSYPISHNPRLTDPKLGGGALLDVGVYGVNFMLMHMGNAIEKIESSVQMTSTGVDAQESVTVHFEDGRIAVLTHGIYSRSDRKGIFYGEKGYVVVQNINNPSEINVYDNSDTLLEHYEVPKQISGYEYEFLESRECLMNGQLESHSMPLEDSAYMMGVMDEIRKCWEA